MTPHRPEDHHGEIQSLRDTIARMESAGAERKLADTALQESEKKYRTIFENTGTATILIEADTTIAMVNGEFEQLSGFSRDEVEGKKSWTDFIAPEDVRRMLEYHAMRRQGKPSAPRNYECRMIGRSGEIHTCYMTVALIPDTGQSVASLLDITDRIKFEEALRESEERFRLLVETMSDGLGVQDEKGIVTYVNERICQITGYPREEIIGRPTTDLLHDYYRDKWREEMRKREELRYDPYEVAWKNKEGRTIHTIVSPRPLFDAKGNYAGSFAVFTDITERMEAEKALRSSEDKFSKGFRLSPDAMTITTLQEGRFIEVNDSFLKITGYTRNEIIGRTVLDCNIWPDADYRRDLIGRLLSQGRLKDVDIRFRVKTGGLRYGIYSAELIELQGETCIISGFADVTEQRRLEREILDISEKERRVIGQDLHDDLQQHLIGIEAMASLLENRLKDKQGEKKLTADMVQHIREAIEKTRRMARGLCPVSLDERGLVSALNSMAADISSRFGIHCSVQAPGMITGPDDVTSVQLYHIVQEAVNNAVRHGRPRNIDIFIDESGGALTVSVADDGKGIPDAVVSRGLGLTIMNYRAQMIGAVMDIERRREGGTRVTCLLRRR